MSLSRRPLPLPWRGSPMANSPANPAPPFCRARRVAAVNQSDGPAEIDKANRVPGVAGDARFTFRVTVGAGVEFQHAPPPVAQRELRSDLDRVATRKVRG